MAEKDMSVPFALSLAGGIITLIGSLAVGAWSIFLATLASGIGRAATALGVGGVGTGFGIIAGMIIARLVIGLIISILIIVGAIAMKKPKKARLWSILVLIFSIIGFFGPGWGLIIGPVLGIIGGAIGISHSK